jgi:hypothetical protein
LRALTWKSRQQPSSRTSTLLTGCFRIFNTNNKCTGVCRFIRGVPVGIYDAWTGVLRTADPRFEFTDPLLRHSLPMAWPSQRPRTGIPRVLTGPASSPEAGPG